MKQITLLGATGSIGIQTLDVIQEHPEEFQLYGMAFGRNVEKALSIINKFQPKKVVVQDDFTKNKISNELMNTEILVGNDGMI